MHLGWSTITWGPRARVDSGDHTHTVWSHREARGGRWREARSARRETARHDARRVRAGPDWCMALASVAMGPTGQSKQLGCKNLYIM